MQTPWKEESVRRGVNPKLKLQKIKAQCNARKHKKKIIKCEIGRAQNDEEHLFGSNHWEGVVGQLSMQGYHCYVRCQ
jgi:hypothetical protein